MSVMLFGRIPAAALPGRTGLGREIACTFIPLFDPSSVCKRIAIRLRQHLLPHSIQIQIQTRRSTFFPPLPFLFFFPA